jgi:hypothetical protein
MIRAVFNFFKYRKIYNIPNYSFTLSKYVDENDIYYDIENIDIDIEVDKYSTHKISREYSPFLLNDSEIKKFLDFFIGKLLERYDVEENKIYIRVNDKTIRIKNTSILNDKILRIDIEII